MKNLITALFFGLAITSYSQSDNCVTATVINLDANGSACVNGTTAGATSENILFGACNAAGVNEVWYTYVATGSQNDYTLNPGTMQDAQIVVQTGACPLAGTLQFCDVAVGGASSFNGWGIPAGTQVWVGIMSNSLNDGTFQLCVDSYSPPPTGGNGCAGAIPVCSGTTVVDMNPLNSSGVFPSCFGAGVNQDVWFTFDVLQGGTFEWSAVPSGISTNVELDWALYDVSGGCPGAEIDCNYNFDGGANAANGQTPGGTGEFNTPSNLPVGTYAIVIDFFSSGGVGTMDFSVNGGSAIIAPDADFTINPAGPICGPSVNVTVNDLSIGVPTWDFGDGSAPFVGNNPPAHNYTAPGTYAITATIGGACPSIHTEFIQLFGPLVVAPVGVDETCPGDCDGSASVAPTGGSGIYSYSWSPGGATTPNATGLCAGNYTVTVTDATCGAAPAAPVTINSGVCACSITNMTANIGACNAAAGDYTTTGIVEFVNPPATGQLIVQDCNGFNQTFNAPFTTPTAYSISGQTPDGLACDITAFFTSDPGCTQVIPYPAPICPCNMDSLNVLQGLCDPSTDTYGYTGNLGFTSAPATGQLIISADNGTTTYDTIILPPFTSPYNWSISGIPADGQTYNITVYFSNDPGCSISVGPITAPTTCLCGVNIGTFNDNITGSSTNNYVLCYGDQIDINPNGDLTPPGEQFTSPPQAAPPVYDPGIWWFLYSCPPTVAVTPDPILLPWVDDPCFLGAYNTQNLSDLNTPGILGSYPAGTFTNNIAYWIPITMYSMSTGTVSFVTGGTLLPCYEMGTTYPVQYLPDFFSSDVEDCLAGTATITVNGGLPEIDGTNFTASNLLPATASFANTTTGDFGTFGITALQGGDMWSFTVTDGNGCPYLITGGPFPPLEDPGFSYNPASWCTADPVANPIVTGVAGGTYVAAPAGLSINAATGQITPATSTPGTYNVTYTTPGACFDDSTFVVTVAATPSVNPILDQTVCDGVNFTTINFTGSAGSTFNWANDNTATGLGVSGIGDIAAFTGTAPVTQEVSNIVVTPTAGSCTGPTESFTLTVNPQEIATFNYPATAWCTSDVVQAVNITGTAGGTFAAIPAGLSINAATGAITPATSTPGSYDITYTTAGVCFASSTITIDINEVPSVDPVVDQTVCEGFDFTTITFVGPTTGTSFNWTNSNTNIGLGAVGAGNIGAFTGATSGGIEVGTITVTPSTANCTGAPMDVILTVNPTEDASFTYPGGLTYCQTGTDPVGNITGTLGGTFSYTVVSGGPTLSLNTATGDVVLATSSLGTYDITYTTPGACVETSTLTMVITNNLVADFSFGVYCANDTDPMPNFVQDDAGVPFATAGSGGVFTAVPAGLSINAATGLVDLSASTPGTYTVTNTIPASGACPSVNFVDDIVINGLPDANIVGATTICATDPIPDVTINVTAGTGPWTVDYTLNGAAAQESIAAGGLPVAHTFNAGLGTYSLTQITDDITGCASAIAGQVILDTYPTPSVDPLVNQYRCEGDNLLVQTFTGSPAGVTFQWDNTGNDIGFGLAGTGQIGSFFTTVGQADVTVTPYGPNTTAASPLGCVGPTESFSIIIAPNPVPAFVADTLIGCEPFVVTFTNQTSNSTTCIWDFGDGNTVNDCGPVTNTYSAGIFDVTLTVTTSAGCSASFTAPSYIEVISLPVASFSFMPQEITVEDPVVEFTNNSFNADSYSWDFGDNSFISSLENPIHEFPSVPGEYLVTLWAYNNGQMCADMYQQLVIIQDVLIFYVPNIFTPDGDEFNETFQPVFTSGFDRFDYHLTIFNRWGEIIFESFDDTKGWNGHYGDGGLVQDGIYIWQIEFKEAMSDRRHEKRGHVTVLK